MSKASSPRDELVIDFDLMQRALKPYAKRFPCSLVSFREDSPEIDEQDADSPGCEDFGRGAAAAETTASWEGAISDRSVS